MSMAASKSLPLFHGDITLDTALEGDENMLQKIAYPEKRIDFYLFLYNNRSDIEAVVSRHLGLSKTDTCEIGGFEDWMAGSFNVCIPMKLNSPRFPRRVLIRFPLPYKVGESSFAGNADEKVRCEAATYLSIQDNCPTVPIPVLWGFGFSGGQSFTKPELAPFHSRLLAVLRRTLLSFFRYPIPCRYVRHTCPNPLGVSYLLIEFVEQTDGKKLSATWKELNHDQDRRKNLFRDMSRIMLALGTSHLPRIGSMTIDDGGFVSLANRPLTLRLQHLENEGVPTNIDRSLTYSATESYALDLLAYHDNRIRHQPNSVYNEFDARAQMAILTMMRAVLPSFLDRSLRHGPFIFTLTDLHQNNILVDDDWNIKRLIDLEWACSLPVEMQRAPHWLTSRGVDELPEGERLDAFSRVHEEFLDAFEREENALSQRQKSASYRAGVMRKGWKIGNFWYFHALDSPRGMMNLWLQHIHPAFTRTQDDDIFDQIVAPYWATDAAEVVMSKVKDKEVYDGQLRQAFKKAAEEAEESEKENP